jgi:hypothetical protein
MAKQGKTSEYLKEYVLDGSEEDYIQKIGGFKKLAKLNVEDVNYE